MLPQVSGEFRCVADPELRFTPSGVAVGKVRAVASSRKKDEATGEWADDKVCWINVVTFKQQAENVIESLKKGDLFVLTGRLQTEEWEDKEGNKRTSIEVVADNIGPSTRWAPARHVATDRREGGQQQSGGDDTKWESTGGDAAPSDEPPF